jgi:hypothetical protein
MSDCELRESTTAYKVIEFLKGKPAGTTIDTKTISTRFDCKNPSSAMKKAVDAGMVVGERVGQRIAYALPEPDAPADGALLIASYSDGDVSIKGGAAQDDGSVVYTREQLSQLFTQITTPHLVLPPVTAQEAGA